VTNDLERIAADGQEQVDCTMVSTQS
jgi:hypothetical protein